MCIELYLQGILCARVLLRYGPHIQLLVLYYFIYQQKFTFQNKKEKKNDPTQSVG